MFVPSVKRLEFEIRSQTNRMHLFQFFPVTWTSCLLISFLLCLYYLYLTKDHGYWEKRGVPSRRPLFMAGNLWEVFSGQRQIGKHLGHLYREFSGPYFGIYICGKPYLVLRSPDIIKQVAIRDFHNFEDRTFACDKTVDKMTANSLFIIRNPEWRNIRNRLSCIFTSGKIKQMYPLMVGTAQALQKYLEKHDGQVLEIKEVAGKYMTDLVAKCFFGIENDSFTGASQSEFRIACQKILEMDLYRSFSLFCYFFVPKWVSLFKLKFLDTRYMERVFLETLAHRERTGFKRNDFVDLLISVKEAFSKESENGGTKFDTTCMVAQAITFFVAGFETTSNLLGFALYELSLRQDCQDALRQEIFTCFPHESDPITFDRVQQMKYLDMVISETLRRYPFGPFLNRKCKNDYVIEETGLVVEKNTPILIPIDGIHFDPNFYPQPEKFEPERFREGNKRLANSCVYMPFGIGPRNCIGDRFGQICAKIGLVHFLRKFKVEKCHLTQDPIILDPKSPFMTPTEGLQLRIRKL